MANFEFNCELILNVLKFVVTICTTLIQLVQNIQKGVKQNG